MIAWSVGGDHPSGPVGSGAADNYPAAVQAMLETVRHTVLDPARAAAVPTRYVLYLDGDQVAALGMGTDPHGHPDRDGALEHLTRIEDALTNRGGRAHHRRRSGLRPPASLDRGATGLGVDHPERPFRIAGSSHGRLHRRRCTKSGNGGDRR